MLSVSTRICKSNLNTCLRSVHASASLNPAVSPRLAVPDKFHSSELQKRLHNGTLPLPPSPVRANVLHLALLVRPEINRYLDANHLPACSPSLSVRNFSVTFQKNQFWSPHRYTPASPDRNSYLLAAASSKHLAPDCRYSPILTPTCIQKSDHMPFFSIRIQGLLQRHFCIWHQKFLQTPCVFYMNHLRLSVNQNFRCKTVDSVTKFPGRYSHK